MAAKRASSSTVRIIPWRGLAWNVGMDVVGVVAARSRIVSREPSRKSWYMFASYTPRRANCQISKVAEGAQEMRRVVRLRQRPKRDNGDKHLEASAV